MSTNAQQSGPQTTLLIPKATPIFCTSRKDGLGARLIPFLIAKVLATKSKGTFVFDWAEIPIMNLDDISINTAEKTFTSEFRCKFMVQDFKSQIAPLTYLPVQKLLSSFMPESETYLLDFYPETKYLPDIIKQVLAPLNIDHLFSSIGFLPKLINAYNLGRKLGEQRKFSALHLRSGDIVYGPHRYSGQFTDKAVAFPLGYLVNKQEVNDGLEVIVFGEEQAFAKTLQEDFGSVLADQLAPQLKASDERAFFDIGLMSTARKIYSAESSFAVTAALIAGSEMINPYKTLDIELVQSTIITLFENQQKFKDTNTANDAKQRAFWMYAFYQNYKSALTYADRIHFLELAHSAEPENKLYKLVSNYEALLNIGATIDLALLLEDSADFSRRGAIWEILRNRFVGQYIEIYARYAKQNSEPYTAICAAYHYSHFNNHQETKGLATIFIKNRPSHLAWIDDIAQGCLHPK